MGGNVFQGTRSIKKEHIEETVGNYFEELKNIFPKKAKYFNKKYFHYLGSVGKKPVSGDIDFGIDSTVFDLSDKGIRDWNIDPESVKKQYQVLKKRAKTATDKEVFLRSLLQHISGEINKTPNIYTDPKKITPGTMFSLYPQYIDGVKQEYGVQVDWMIGDIDLLKFSYYSDTYPEGYKGLMRTQLIVSLFKSVEVTYSHTKGISKDKKLITKKPDEILDFINKEYSLRLTKKIVQNYFTFNDYLRKHLSKRDYDKVLNIYFGILSHTRTDIPQDLHTDWRRLNKKHKYETKFLPQDSKLLQEQEQSRGSKKSSGSIGGFKDYLSESKPTRQLKNLNKKDLIDFLHDFVYDIKKLNVTEKIAGQMLGTKYSKEEGTLVRPKAMKTFFRYTEYNYHRDVMILLDNFYRLKNKEQEINFEVVSPKAHDYIVYPEQKVVIDFSGVLTQADKKILNTNEIRFLTKEDIEIKHSEGIKKIEKMLPRWEKSINSVKTLKELRSLILPEIQDQLGTYIAKEFNSALSKSSAVEGFFMMLNGQSFKIANKIYADLQRINVVLYNILKMPRNKVIPRLEKGELVKDLTSYLEKNIDLDLSSQYRRIVPLRDSIRILERYNITRDPVEMYNSLRKYK